MPNIFDNIEKKFVEALLESLKVSYKADFCIGYFNLRGWRRIDKSIETWQGGNNNSCRLLIGMQKLPQEELKILESITLKNQDIDNNTALRLKNSIAEDFKNQLTIGAPSNIDEITLRRLAKQLKKKK